MVPILFKGISLIILVCAAIGEHLTDLNSDKQSVPLLESLNTLENYESNKEVHNINIPLNSTTELLNTTIDYNQTDVGDLYANVYEISREIHGIDPHSNILPNEYNSGIFPSTHPRYKVRNIGRDIVFAKTIYGTAFGWIGDVSSYTIQPTVTQTLENYGKSYYITGVQIYNRQSTRAIVEVTGGVQKSDNSPWAGFDKNKALKGAFAMGVKFIPYVGKGLSALISAFWPENKPSVWEQVHDQVKSLLDDKIQQTISGILDGDIRYMKERIAALDRETKSNKRNDLANHYMNIAQDLIGFEQKFEFRETSTPDYLITNFNILPEYSTVITMKMHFYAIGIGNPQLFQLSDNQIKMIKQYAFTTLYGTNSNGAISYVRKMYRDAIDETYRTVYAGGLYNVMMNARSHIALHGLELIPVWEQAYNEPGSDKNPYIDAISFSNFFGRSTANLFQQATPSDVPAPLTPPLKSDKQRVSLVSIEFYIWRIYGNGPARIGGIKLIFEGSIIYNLGKTTNEVQRLDLNGRTITKLRAYGRGAVDSLEFTLSDGKTSTFGSAGSDIYADFELKDHHISSMYLANDDAGLGGQAANIAVSFLQNPLKK